MVTRPAHGRAAAGRHFDFHRQLRHCLGALTISLIHARAAQCPRHFGVLSRRRAALVCDGRIICAAQEERFTREKMTQISRAGGSILSPPSKPDAGATGRRCFL
jgi:hypothetical protein